MRQKKEGARVDPPGDAVTRVPQPTTGVDPAPEPRAWTDRFIREVLWANHGCTLLSLYGDDGELQCGNCRMDFRREPLPFLIGTLMARGRLHAGIPPAAVPVSQLRGLLEAWEHTGEAAQPFLDLQDLCDVTE
jgi:hypothetical protein